MKAWERGQVALYTGVALTTAVGTILAVLLGNVPLGAAIGIAAGIAAVLLMWPWNSKTDERQ